VIALDVEAPAAHGHDQPDRRRCDPPVGLVILLPKTVTIPDAPRAERRVGVSQVRSRPDGLCLRQLVFEALPSFRSPSRESGAEAQISGGDEGYVVPARSVCCRRAYWRAVRRRCCTLGLYCLPH